jgi:hypothetical protein
VRLTNRLGLPDALVRAIAADDYSRGACDISVTQLISPPRLAELRRLHEQEIEEDAAERIWLLMGKIAHGILEKAETAELTEERFFAPAPGGWTFSGALDRLALLDNANRWRVQDYKVTSTWAVRDGGKREWEEQLNLYALLLRAHGFDVEALEIVAICRDWRKAEARRYADRGYPAHQVAVLPVLLWGPARAETFLAERVAAHQAARDAVALPYCSAEDRWQDATAWEVWKAGNKRRSAAYGTREGAEAAIAAAAPGTLTITERPGVPKRCAEYCAVREHCIARADGQWTAAELAAVEPFRAGPGPTVEVDAGQGGGGSGGTGEAGAE